MIDFVWFYCCFNFDYTEQAQDKVQWWFCKKHAFLVSQYKKRLKSKEDELQVKQKSKDCVHGKQFH